MVAVLITPRLFSIELWYEINSALLEERWYLLGCTIKAERTRTPLTRHLDKLGSRPPEEWVRVETQIGTGLSSGHSNLSRARDIAFSVGTELDRANLDQETLTLLLERFRRDMAAGDWRGAERHIHEELH